MRIAHITDLHLAPETGKHGYEVDTAESLRRVIEAIKALETPVNAIVATGDIADDGSKQSYDRFIDLLEDVNAPTYVLPGNHDDVSAMRSSFVGGNTHYTRFAEFEDWSIIFLNSQVPGQPHGYLDASELEALETIALGLNGRPTLVALHHTPSKVCALPGCQLHNLDLLDEVLSRNTHIKGVIAGHTHTATETTIGALRQFTTPSTFCVVTHAQDDGSDHSSDDDFWSSHSLDTSRYGFRTLDLHADGRIESEVHWIRHMSEP